MMTEYELVSKYLKVPYRHGGMDIKEGLNCWGLVKSVYKDLGIPLLDTVDFIEQIPKTKYAHTFNLYKDKVIRVDNPKPFDIVLLEVDGYLHAGIVLSQLQFLHTCKSGTGVCRLNHINWRNKIVGYYRAR